MNRKFKEIDTIVRSLNHSIDAHFKWLVKILRFVSSRDALLPEVTCDDAHNLCDFGHWLNMHLHENKADKNYLLDIKNKHIHVHKQCRQLIKMMGDNETSHTVFDDFETALLAFTASVMRYKTHLLQLRTSYDALTGLPLRRILDESFDSINGGLANEGLYLLLLDVDHFKKINDNYGHLTGDAVLRSLALNLENNIRRAESVYRYGGEEFIILLQASSDREATEAAERIRRKIEATEIVSGAHSVNITFSSGLTRVHHGEVLQEILERADIALYKGKQSGRNCTILINKSLDCINVSY